MINSLVVEEGSLGMAVRGTVEGIFVEHEIQKLLVAVVVGRIGVEARGAAEVVALVDIAVA